MGKLLLATIAVILAPVVGGLIAGLDRKLTAKLQSRVGPPILQPFYDVFKLFGKSPMIVNPWQILSVWVYLVSSALTVFLFFMGSDLLLMFFVMTIGAVFFVMGALSTQSPYAQVGAQRELITMLTYEPLIILVFVSISMVTGSFKVSEVFNQTTPLLYQLPLIFIVLGYALTIKLRNRCGLGEGLLDCSVQTLDHAAGSSLCCHHAEPAPYLKAGDTALSQCRYIR